MRAGGAGATGAGVAVGTRAGVAVPGVGAGAVIGMRAVSTTDAGADASTGIAASNVQPAAIPTATAAKPPITKRVFDSSIGVPFLDACIAIAAVLGLV